MNEHCFQRDTTTMRVPLACHRNVTSRQRVRRSKEKEKQSIRCCCCSSSSSSSHPVSNNKKQTVPSAILVESFNHYFTSVSSLSRVVKCSAARQQQGKLCLCEDVECDTHPSLHYALQLLLLHCNNLCLSVCCFPLV